MNIETSPDSRSDVSVVKRGRGRPTKYATLGEKQEKKKEQCRAWYAEHKEENNEYHRIKYREDPEKSKQRTTHRQRITGDAIRLLRELWEANQLQVTNDRFKTMIEDLVVHNKSIYTHV